MAIKKEDYSSSSEYDYNDNGANNCNKVYNEEEFVLQSPNYPRGYPEGVMCTTVVYPANANICSLELRFDEFKVESSATVGNCPEDGDYLEIIDEDMQGLAKSQRYCGVFTGIRLLEMRKLKRFVFHSGLDGSGGDVGYSIVVKVLDLIYKILCNFTFVSFSNCLVKHQARPPLQGGQLRGRQPPQPSRRRRLQPDQQLQQPQQPLQLQQRFQLCLNFPRPQPQQLLNQSHHLPVLRPLYCQHISHLQPPLGTEAEVTPLQNRDMGLPVLIIAIRSYPLQDLVMELPVLKTTIHSCSPLQPEVADPPIVPRPT